MSERAPDITVEADGRAESTTQAVLVAKGSSPPGDLGAALVGRQLLYWWQDDGWQRGTVARL